MKIGHASDLHGHYERLERVEAPDVWVLTGDFFPNVGRQYTGRIEAEAERAYQLRWWRHKGPSVVRRLRGRPVVVCDGNHDFIPLAHALRNAGHPAPVFDVEAGAPIDLQGHRFAGFRAVPWIQLGEWVGEQHSFDAEIERVWAHDPTILVTHAPPAGILDGGFGIAPLTTALTHRPHKIVLHLFGHIHEHGGQEHEELGVRFVNGSLGVRVLEISEGSGEATPRD